MPLLTLPTELLYNVVDLLHPRDHAALTLTNRQLAGSLQPYLLSRLRTLPLLGGDYALLAVHWASVTANLPLLKNLLETIPDITVNDNTPPPPTVRRRYTIGPGDYTTAGPCPPTAWKWISTRGPNLRIFHAASRTHIGFWSRRGLTSAEYAINTNNHALLRLSLSVPRSQLSAQFALRYAARHGRMHSLEVALGLFREMFGKLAWERARKEALQIAELRGVQYLLPRGTSINARDALGRTLLHRAVSDLILGGEGMADSDGTVSHPEVVRTLLTRGANVDSFDRDGATALHVAAGLAHVEIVELLLLGGAGVDVRDADGCSPAHRALRGHGLGKWDVVELLRLHGADFGVVDSTGVSARSLMEGPRELRSSARRRVPSNITVLVDSTTVD